MASIPKDISALSDRIYEAYEKEVVDKPQRLSRIGASGIGKECVRAIWFDWRGATKPQFPGRILRLFETGHQQEARVLADLERAGLQVWAFQEDGEQWTYTDSTGHAVAKLDGIVKGVPGAEKTVHTLEIKSSNLKGFQAVQKQGVQKAKPLHYAQIQMGMMLSPRINDSLYVMVCKDDEALYSERVKRDQTYIFFLQSVLATLLQNDNAPMRVTENKDGWECKYCDHKAVCWKESEPVKNCRMCVHSKANDLGQWECLHHNAILNQQQQLEGCPAWQTVL